MSAPVAALVLCQFAVLPGVVMSAEPTSSDWKCTSDNIERQIALFLNDGPEPAPSVGSEGSLACWVVYSKDGNSEVLWQARNDPNYCEPRVLALLENLQKAGFRCELSAERAISAEMSSAAAAEPDDGMLPPPAETPSARSNDNVALRSLLERHYEGNYLDAMMGAIPAGFSVRPEIDAVSTKSGDILYVGPPNHFVKTMSDGSYVLVNTLVLQRGSASSFVNLGIAVRNERYRFLGYATVRSAVEAKVMKADRSEVTLMATPAATQSCAGLRRMRTLRWVSDFEFDSLQQGTEPLSTRAAPDSDCGD